MAGSTVQEHVERRTNQVKRKNNEKGNILRIFSNSIKTVDGIQERAEDVQGAEDQQVIAAGGAQ